MAQPANATNDFFPIQDFSTLSINSPAIPGTDPSSFGEASASFTPTTSQMDNTDYYTAQAAGEEEDYITTQDEDGPVNMGDHIFYPYTSKSEAKQGADGKWVCNWFSTQTQGDEEPSTSQTLCRKTYSRECDLR